MIKHNTLKSNLLSLVLCSIFTLFNSSAVLGQSISAPIVQTVTPGNIDATLVFNPPATVIGTKVDKYEYTLNGGLTWSEVATVTSTTSGGTTTTTVTVESLTINTDYILGLRGVGTTTPTLGTAASVVFTTEGLTAPTILSITSLDTGLRVSVQTPTATTEPVVEGYEYQVDSGEWVEVDPFSNVFDITDLDNGVTYSVTVRAVNSNGPGASSVTKTGVPRGSSVAWIQFINNNLTAGTLDVLAEGTRIVNDLQSGKATALNVVVDSDEAIPFVVTNADNSTTHTTFTHTFENGKYYVVVFGGGLNDKPFDVKVVDNVRNESTVATAVQYRFFNGFANLNTVNLQRVTTSTPRVPEGANQGLVGVSVGYGTAAGYYTHDTPGFTTFQVLSAGNVVGQFMFDLGSFGSKKTLFILGTGLTTGENTTALNLVAYDVTGNVVTSKVTTNNHNEGVQVPSEFVLYNNFPNPFNPTTSIRFDLPEMANVRIEVVDLLGRQVMMIPSQSMTAGSNKVVTLDASRLSSGVYFYKVIAEGANRTFVQASKFTLLK